jgi:GNAT superfamily N-acetyltransferase
VSEAALGPIQVTVTFLEMNAPPRTYPHAPSNRQIALLRAKDMPLHFYRYLMDRVGRKWHWVNALRLSDDALAAMIDKSDIGVLYLDGAPAGFFEIRMHAPDTAELAFFGLMEHATGQGLGRWFLGAAIEAAWSHHPSRVSVQTCTLDHPAALPLYQKLGFSPVGQQTETVQPISQEERAGLVTR